MFAKKYKYGINVVILKSLPTKKARKPKTNKQTYIQNKTKNKNKTKQNKKTLKQTKTNKQIKRVLK